MPGLQDSALVFLRSVEPIAEIAESRDDELVGVQSLIDHRREIVTSG